MTRLRARPLGLALAALIGLWVGEVRAATISMTIETNGFTIDVTGNPLYVISNTGTSLVLDNDALNSDLVSLFGSAYQFANLGASSNFPGSANPMGGTLSQSAILFIPAGAGGATGDISITVSLDGYTAPTGPNPTLRDLSGAGFTNTTAGDDQVSHSDFNSGSLVTTDTTFTSTGPALNGGSLLTSATGGGVVGPTYSLLNTVTINLTASSSSQSQDSYFVNTQLTTAVPEPTSIVVMMTSMPLPLIVLGMLRRRRRAGL
jgi:hypothetical protein